MARQRKRSTTPTVKNTSGYPDEEVRRLVLFALADLGVVGVHVNVKNSSRIRRGMAYFSVPSIANVPPGTRKLITIGIGPPYKFPYENGYWNSKARKDGKPRRGGLWPEVTLQDWREALVHTAAHEAKHIERYVYGGEQSELACEHHAAWVLNRYRAQEEAA